MLKKLCCYVALVLCVVLLPGIAVAGCADAGINAADKLTWTKCIVNGKVINVDETEYVDCARVSGGVANAKKCRVYCRPNGNLCAGEIVVGIEECETNYRGNKSVPGMPNTYYAECVDAEAWCNSPAARGVADSTVWGQKGQEDITMVCHCKSNAGDDWVRWDVVDGKCAWTPCYNKCNKLAQAGDAIVENSGLCRGIGKNKDKVWDKENCEFKNAAAPSGGAKPGTGKTAQNTQLIAEVADLRRDMRRIESGFKTSVWKTAEGNFNGARLASDSVAGVVLGTAGGLITSNIIKKNQVSGGFEDLRCTIGGQVVSGFGDVFQVGINVAHKK